MATPPSFKTTKPARPALLPEPEAAPEPAADGWPLLIESCDLPRTARDARLAVARPERPRRHRRAVNFTFTTL